MSNYITTYTGKHFEPTKPDADKICIEDIAHALSLICRGKWTCEDGLVRRAALHQLREGSLDKGAVEPHGTRLPGAFCG